MCPAMRELLALEPDPPADEPATVGEEVDDESIEDEWIGGWACACVAKACVAGERATGRACCACCCCCCLSDPAPGEDLSRPNLERKPDGMVTSCG